METKILMLDDIGDEVQAFSLSLQSRGLSERTIYEYTNDLFNFLKKT